MTDIFFFVETHRFHAAQDGHLNIVKCLISAGADLEKAAEDGATPLIIAAQSEQLKTVSFLAEAKADLKLGDLQRAAGGELEGSNMTLKDTSFFGGFQRASMLRNWQSWNRMHFLLQSESTCCFVGTSPHPQQ